MAEDVGERAALRDRAAKGVVGVGGDDVARRVGVAEDVAVGVGVGNVDHAVALDIEESAHAARALLRAGEVVAQEAFDCPSRSIGERNPLKDDVAAIVCEGVSFARLPLVAVETFDALHGSAHRRHRTVADGAVDVNRSVANATRAARNIKSGSSMNWNHCS